MRKRLIPTLILAGYSALLVQVLVLKDLPTIRVGKMMFRFGGTATGEANFVPFASITPYLLGQRGSLIGLVNVAGNIALLIPVGLLIPIVFRRVRWWMILVLAVGIGILLEGTQMLLEIGIFDIDDVILNALGVVVGYVLFAVFSRVRQPAP